MDRYVMFVTVGALLTGTADLHERMFAYEYPNPLYGRAGPDNKQNSLWPVSKVHYEQMGPAPLEISTFKGHVEI